MVPVFYVWRTATGRLKLKLSRMGQVTLSLRRKMRNTKRGKGYGSVNLEGRNQFWTGAHSRVTDIGDLIAAAQFCLAG